MIEFIFTVDYEIYGNGEGSLKELVYDPAEKLKAIFDKWNARFVTFVEVAELEMIESRGTDQDIAIVKQQIRDFFRDGFELGLHLHQWWYNAQFDQGKWQLDYSEYNLCALPKERIIQIVDRSITYLREFLDKPDFTPLSFRAGHLLFHPARNLAIALAERGIKVDSSVYKGGLWHQHKLDYRRALRNGYYWKFTDCANVPDPQGVLLELPIFTQMVPTWKMFTSKRVGLKQRGASTAQTGKRMMGRLRDFLRLSYPLKFDLGQMTKEEIMCMAEKAILEDQKNPSLFRPIVVLMHTKDPLVTENIESLLSYLETKGVKVSDFNDVYNKGQILNQKMTGKEKHESKTG